MIKERLWLVLILFFVVGAGGFVSAVGVSDTDVSDTLKQVSVSGASNLYAYEVNFSIDSGSISDVDFTNFLSEGGAVFTSTGYNVKNSYLYVYESRLDSGQTGVSGDSEIFNISYSGELTLRGLLAIDSSGTETYVSYNVPAEESTGDTTSTGGDTGGSTSGGGAITADTPRRENLDLVVVPSEITVDAILGVSEEEEVVVYNRGETLRSYSLATEGLDDYIEFESNSVTLGSGGEKTIKFTIKVDQKSLIAGKILLVEGGIVAKEIPVVVNVRSEDFLFDAKVTVPWEYKSVNIGTNLLVDINLLQVGPEEKVDVVANYIIKDFSGNIFLEESETFYVLGSKLVTKELHTAGLPEGDYVVGLEIVYPGAFAVSSAQFSVGKKTPFGLDVTTWIIIGGAIAILIAIIVVIWATRSGKKARKKR